MFRFIGDCLRFGTRVGVGVATSGMSELVINAPDSYISSPKRKVFYQTITPEQYINHLFAGANIENELSYKFNSKQTLALTIDNKKKYFSGKWAVESIHILAQNDFIEIYFNKKYNCIAVKKKIKKQPATFAESI